jgi:ATP-dependent phosphoenolpyruvate carboxykinase
MYFGLSIPKEVAGVESKMLQPENTWVDKEKYHETIKHLERLFEKITKNMNINHSYNNKYSSGRG